MFFLSKQGNYDFISTDNLFRNNRSFTASSGRNMQFLHLKKYGDVDTGFTLEKI